MSDHVSQEAQFDWTQPLEELDWSWLDAFDWDAVGLGTGPADTQERRWLHCQSTSHASQGMDDSLFQPMPGCELSSGPRPSFDLDNSYGTSTSGTSMRHRSRSPASEQHLGYQREPRPPGKLACMECSARFSRPWELSRHTLTQHQKEKRFVCTVTGCFKGRSPPAFARPDKLTDHYKKAHKRDDLVECPAKNCERRFTLELIGAHIDFAHTTWVVVKEELRPLRNASDAHHRKCPYWRCRKHVKLASFLEHIVSHSLDDLNAMEEDLRQERYFYVRNGCSHLAPVEGIHNCLVTALCILCPICDEVCGSHAAFEQHFTIRHLLLQDAASCEHFFQWKNHVESNTTVRSGSKSPSPWKEWYDRDWKKNSKRECPFCRKNLESRWRHDASKHHIRLLRNAEEAIAELYPHGQAILRLYPDFKSHPVFADLK